MDRNHVRKNIVQFEWIELLMKKMDSAIKNGYYFEAMSIEYIILYDRCLRIYQRMSNSPNEIHDHVSEVSDSQSFYNLINDIKAHSDASHINILMPIASATEGQLISSNTRLKNNYDTVLKEQKLYSTTNDTNNQTLSIYTGNPINTTATVNLLDCIDKWRLKRNKWEHRVRKARLSNKELLEEMRPFVADGAIMVRALCRVARNYKKKKKGNLV